MEDVGAEAGDWGEESSSLPSTCSTASHRSSEAGGRPEDRRERRLGGGGWLVRKSGEGRRIMGARSRGLGVKAPQLALLLGCCVASSSAFMVRPPLPLSAATTRGAALGTRSFQLRFPQHVRTARLPVAGCGQGRCRAHHETTRMQRRGGQGEPVGLLNKFSELVSVLRQMVSLPVAQNPCRNTPTAPGRSPTRRFATAATLGVDQCHDPPQGDARTVLGSWVLPRLGAGTPAPAGSTRTG